MSSAAKKSKGIPVLVVSGFLGSGKTTFVRHLLERSKRAGVRLAILSNEFGELGIDASLLGAGEGRSVELGGGCVCCELSDELVEVLEALRVEVEPDWIVIETSGVALPYEVQLSLWRPPVSEWAVDDMAVVLVNAEQLAEDRDLGDTFEQQVSAADLLVLNQIDRVSDAVLPELEARLRVLEPEVPIVHARFGDVDQALLVPPSLERRASKRDAHPHTHEAFESEVLHFPEPLSEDEIARLLRSERALRAKGFVETPKGPRLVQGVGRRIEFVKEKATRPDQVGRVVVIRARR